VVYGGGLTGREAEAGWWYIDVERVEDGDPTKDARRQTPDASSSSAGGFACRTLTRPSQRTAASTHMCAHRTEITADRLIHCIVRVYTYIQ